MKLRRRLFAWATKDFEGSSKLRNLLTTPERVIIAVVLDLVTFLFLLAYSESVLHSTVVAFILFTIMIILFGLIIIHSPKSMEMLGD